MDRPKEDETLIYKKNEFIPRKKDDKYILKKHIY
jgi:hypothetical protein